MTPETEALIASVRHFQLKRERQINASGAVAMLADLADDLATALEAAEKRADAAEAKLKVAREALDRIKRPVWWMQEDQRKATGSINGLDGHAAARIASDPSFLRSIAETTLTQLEP